MKKRIGDYVSINPEKFDPTKYHNAKKFKKVTQKSLKPHTTYIPYLNVSKKYFTHRDIYMADKGDIILCLMNTKVRLIGIVDCLCVVPNTFCILHPNRISTDVLYALLHTSFMQKQLENYKPSIKIKDVENMKLPYEINKPEEYVLQEISENFKNSILNRKEVNEIIDSELTNAMATLPLKLEDFIHFEEISQRAVANSYGKSELPDEGILICDIEGHDSVTILLSRKLKQIDDLKVGLIPNDDNLINVNQNLIKLEVVTGFLEEIGFDLERTNSIDISKYLAYYFLSSIGKRQLVVALETKGLNPVKTLKINKLKEIEIPLPIKEIPYIVKRIDEQINWHDTKYYSKQFDNSAELFQQFKDLSMRLEHEKKVTYFVDVSLFEIREFGLYLARYIDGNNLGNCIRIGVVLESWIHLALFSRQDEKSWEWTSVEFYKPIDKIDADIVIVIHQLDDCESLNVSENAKVIYIKEMK